MTSIVFASRDPPFTKPAASLNDVLNCWSPVTASTSANAASKPDGGCGTDVGVRFTHVKTRSSSRTDPVVAVRPASGPVVMVVGMSRLPSPSLPSVHFVRLSMWFCSGLLYSLSVLRFSHLEDVDCWCVPVNSALIRMLTRVLTSVNVGCPGVPSATHPFCARVSELMPLMAWMPVGIACSLEHAPRITAAATATEPESKKRLMY